tara:strand:+ start:1980 stop:2456 length:477 start_codon:yes stop_codon:yes gene_type:complete
MEDFNAKDASYNDLKEYAKLYSIRIMGVKKAELRQTIQEHIEASAVNAEAKELGISQSLIKSEIVSDKPLEGKDMSGVKRVKIIIHESADPNAVNPVFVGVNGKGYTISRGEEVDVPTGVVEVLNNARETLYERKKDEYGKEYLSPREALSYPFSILG